MISIDYEIQKNSYKSKMISQVHDELVFEVHKSEKEVFKKLVIDKQKLVREIYFDPTKPSSIEAIYLYCITRYCNMSKRNIRDCLRNIETYQLIFRRQKPRPIKGNFNVTKCGYITCDLFFTGTRYEDRKNIATLCVMDIFSRYCHIKPLENKKKTLVQYQILQFLQELTSFGIKLHSLICLIVHTTELNFQL